MTAVEATPEIAGKVDALAALKSEIKTLVEKAEDLQFTIGEFISPHSILTSGGKEIATWKKQSASRLDGKALAEAEPEIAAKFTVYTTTRVMRLKKKGP